MNDASLLPSRINQEVGQVLQDVYMTVVCIFLIELISSHENCTCQLHEYSSLRLLGVMKIADNRSSISARWIFVDFP